MSAVDRNIDEVAWRIERWTAEYVRNAARRGGGVPLSAIYVWAPAADDGQRLVKVRWDVDGEVLTMTKENSE